MFCTKCGSDIKPGNKFCVKCGAPVYVPEQESSKPQGGSKMQTPGPAREPSKSETPRKEKSGKGIIIALVAVIVILVLAIGGTIGYLVWDRMSGNGKEQEQEEKDTEVIREEESETEEERKGTEAGTEAATEQMAEIVIDSAKVQEAAEAYQAYVQGMKLQEAGFSYAFVNIDADCVPELICDSGVTASGMLLLSYYNGAVCENWLPIGGFHYAEYKNQIYQSSGRMDVYDDVIYHLQSGVLVEDCSGWYGLEDNSVLVDEDGNPIPYKYFWEGEELTEEQYNQQVLEAFDLSAEKKWMAADTVENAFFNYTSGVPELQNLTLQTGDILPTSSTEYLEKEDIQFLTDEELRLARNEIYARHGYTFQDEALRDYFMSKPWYQATVTEVPDTMLNEYEIANRDLIQKMEAERKE